MSPISSIRLSRRGLILGGAGFLLMPSTVFSDDVVFDLEKMLPGEFTWHPERSPDGPVAVVVSIPEQRVHVYRNGVRIAVSTCSTGKPGHETPTGVFTVLQKDKDHRSSTYGGAPMPNMNRLTWDGIALHAGKLPGYPASHGCVRLPMEFSKLLFTITHVGTPVILAGAHDAWELVHPGLVLPGMAEEELETAVADLAARKHPSDWDAAQVFPVTTVLLTAEDRRAVLIENGTELFEDRLTVSGDGKLGEHVYMLRQPKAASAGLEWVGITHRLDPTHPELPETSVLDRLAVTDAFRLALRDRAHPGMTMIVSDLAATPDRRSGEDFVIMAADVVSSPRPILPGETQPGLASDREKG